MRWHNVEIVNVDHGARGKSRELEKTNDNSHGQVILKRQKHKGRGMLSEGIDQRGSHLRRERCSIAHWILRVGINKVQHSLLVIHPIEISLDDSNFLHEPSVGKAVGADNFRYVH